MCEIEDSEDGVEMGDSERRFGERRRDIGGWMGGLLCEMVGLVMMVEV